MSKYNANGGQRRSSKTKLDVPTLSIPVIKCRLCSASESRMNFKQLEAWEKQHMHFEDGDLEFMTCPKCKTINPIKMLEMLGEGDRFKTFGGEG